MIFSGRFGYGTACAHAAANPSATAVGPAKPTKALRFIIGFFMKVPRLAVAGRRLARDPVRLKIRIIRMPSFSHALENLRAAPGAVRHAKRRRPHRCKRLRPLWQALETPAEPAPPHIIGDFYVQLEPTQFLTGIAPVNTPIQTVNPLFIFPPPRFLRMP